MMITLTDCIFRPYPGMIFVPLIPSLSVFIFMLCFIKKMKKKNTHTHNNHIWDKLFKNVPSKISGRQPLKNIDMVCRPYHFIFFKGYLPQILLDPS